MSIERQLKPFQQSTPKSCRMYGFGSAYATRLADKVLVTPATHIFGTHAAAIEHATQGLAHKAVRTGAQICTWEQVPAHEVHREPNKRAALHIKGRTRWPSALQLQTQEDVRTLKLIVEAHQCPHHRGRHPQTWNTCVLRSANIILSTICVSHTHTHTAIRIHTDSCQASFKKCAAQAHSSLFA